MPLQGGRGRTDGEGVLPFRTVGQKYEDLKLFEPKDIIENII